VKFSFGDSRTPNFSNRMDALAPLRGGCNANAGGGSKRERRGKTQAETLRGNEHWRETSLIDVNTYKGNCPRCRGSRPPRPSLTIMPSNENTSKDDTLMRTEPGRVGPPGVESPRWKMSGERPRANSSSSLGVANGTEERRSAEKRDFRSAPRQDDHEKLFRDFFELVLQRAVFQVSLKL